MMGYLRLRQNCNFRHSLVYAERRFLGPQSSRDRQATAQGNPPKSDVRNTKERTGAGISALRLQRGLADLQSVRNEPGCADCSSLTYSSDLHATMAGEPWLKMNGSPVGKNATVSAEAPWRAG